ncbi:hypothetical protein LWI29_036969 [Acer saccharum]|uniref:Uncharacterized protein n=1 Tax=Acer saccharum TaxID=4024 RepID=A0AA39SC06_ACESA|nr:hypothetical protein LWI29_036969 [Acer saccharum]
MENNNEDQKIVSTTSEEDVVIYRGARAMPFIIGMETLDRIGTSGISSNLMVYLTTVFNMKNVIATVLINIFNGTIYVTPLFGGFLSDSYFGRYNTIAFASLSSLIGMTIVMLTAAISQLHPEQHHQPTDWQLAFLLTGLFFLVIASGGFRPCLLPFGADQFNPGTESGKKAISSFFNWYYFTLCIALIISLTLIIYVQSNLSWAIGYAIPSCLMFIACILFFSGSKMYVKVKPQGSPLTSVAQVFVAAIKKRKLKLPTSQNSMFSSLFDYVPVHNMKSKLSNTNQFRFLDKASIITTEDGINSDGSAMNPWRLCSIQQVEEVKCIIRVIPIWLSSIIYHLATVQQQQTYTILQALQSDRQLGNGSSFMVPAASYGIFTYFSPLIWIPIYDQILVPVLRKYTRKKDGLTLLQRMAIGMVIAILTMLVSALVERHRRHLALTRPTLGISPKGGEISSMSAFWLIPQLMLAGLAEAFNSIAQIQFYYQQFPENMRSIGTSIFFCGMAGSSYLNGFLVSIVHHVTSRSSSSGDRDWLPEDLNKGRLDYFFYSIACLGFVNFVYFLVCANWYRYKGGGGGGGGL